MAQATADLDEKATDAQPDEEFAADVLSAFADDDQAGDPTTALDKTADASAKPDSIDTSTADDAAGSTAIEADPEVNELTSALQRIATLEANHKKYSDDVQGRVGLLEQVLKAQAKTPIGKQVRLKKEHFKQFAEEYPEFADAQITAINQVLEELELTGLSQDFTNGLIKESQTAAEKAVEQRYTKQRVLDCREELSDTHPEWMQTIGLPDKDVEAGGVVPDTEFRRWLKTQPDGYGERVLGSYSSVVIGRALDKFNDFKHAQKPQQAKPVPSTRQQQLRAAVAPRTSGSAPTQKKELTWQEAMREEFANS
jgi:hypothetical protein